MKRKIIALITALMMLGGVYGFIGNNQAVYADSASAASLLSAMGIISANSTGVYDLTKALTRGEFAKMIVMASSYKNMVAQNANTSIFKDVKYTHWAAPYIKIAASNSIISGYSDGTFRPDSPITLEQALSSALKVLGYSKTDFSGGAFPYPQVNLSASIGLSAGIDAGVGGNLTKQDGIDLIYNLLNCDLKDGSSIYAVSIGYKVNSSGQIDFASAMSANMNGPITVISGNWLGSLGMKAETVKVYRNGILSSFDAVKTYDIVYYSASSNTIWVYDKKISGVYEKATPNQDAPSSVVVSGQTYQIGSSSAFSSLSSVGSLKPGNTVTLLMDKDGNIADAVSSSLVSSEVVLYITNTGTKVYQNSDGKDYTSNYIAGVTADGTVIDYAVPITWAAVGDVVAIGVDEDSLTVKEVSSDRNLYGVVDSDLMKIGATTLAANVSILDTYQGDYATVSPQRLKGLSLSDSSVLYYKAENGVVSQIILKNITGDAVSYGIILSAQSSSSGMSLSGNYSYMVDGIISSLKTTDRTYNVTKGAAMFYKSTGSLIGMQNITYLPSYKSQKMTLTTVGYGEIQFKFADDVAVYKRSGTNYIAVNVADALAAKTAGKTVDFYYDKLPQDGGRIRIIIIQE
jgi:hypothetical protein